jgi:hypothetical protein
MGMGSRLNAMIATLIMARNWRYASMPRRACSLAAWAMNIGPPRYSR